ncbi:hypothetical protein KDC22_26315 [Paenibacillus tritici]|uniref:hypothetical protein n=1 Tax=Paenibacillus tritici TaxID=1873425 RepID=UPI001BAE056C|nr:hypothetical protein [Paenibacillus tritici]QUL53829.1 hypothetical protein KDC22_26315 [Paenibacillus tritici]
MEKGQLLVGKSTNIEKQLEKQHLLRLKSEILNTLEELDVLNPLNVAGDGIAR